MAEQGSDSDNLTASIIASSDMIYDIYCEVCAEFNKHLEATGYCVECHDYLCDDCVKAHAINRASRNHVVQTKAEMPRQKPSSSFSMPATGACTEKCDLHPDRQIEYYCKDDGCLICAVCLVKHRQCKAVDHISDLSEHLLDSQDYQQFTTSLTTLKTKSKNIIKRSKDNTVQAEKLSTDACTALQELRGKVMNAFDELEQNMKTQTDKLKLADLKRMKDIVDKGIDILDEVEKISADIQTLQSKKQLCQLFVRMIKLEDRVQALHSVLDDAEENNSATDYCFKTSTGIHEILDGTACIGKLSIQDSPETKTSPRKPESQKTPAAAGTAAPDSSAASGQVNIRAVHASDIMIKTDRVKGKCWITGSVLLPGNKMVLTDAQEHKVKLINLETAKVTSSLCTSTKPWGVAKITGEDLVAITLRDEKKIMLVMVTSDLKMSRYVKVDGECTAILHDNNKLIVGFNDPKKVEIMTLNGKVESKIDLDMSKSLSHMALSPRHGAILVTDCNGHCLRRVTLSGVLEAEYRGADMKRPRGVTVDHHGRVLVCTEDSSNILVLTPDLKKSKVLVDGLQWPSSLSLCGRSSKLYVGRNSDEVRVYQLS